MVSLSGDPEGYGKERLCSSRAHTKSHTLWDPGQRLYVERSLGQTYLLILQSPRGRKQLECTLETDTGRSPFGELILPCDLRCWKEPSWNSPFSFLAPGPSRTPTPDRWAQHQYGDASGWATNNRDTTSPTSIQRPSEPTASPAHQRSQTRPLTSVCKH